MTGAVICESGRLDYRLYESGTDKFLTSGFTYFQGYAFQEYPEISAWLESTDMRFVFSEYGFVRSQLKVNISQHPWLFIEGGKTAPLSPKTLWQV